MLGVARILNSCRWCGENRGAGCLVHLHCGADSNALEQHASPPVQIQLSFPASPVPRRFAVLQVQRPGVEPVGPLDPGGRPHRQPGQLSSRLLSVVAAGAVPCQEAGGLFHARFLCLCSQSCSNGLSCNCCHLLQVLEWFRAKGLEAYSISCGQSLLYNNIFPKHKVSEQQALLF